MPCSSFGGRFAASHVIGRTEEAISISVSNKRPVAVLILVLVLLNVVLYYLAFARDADEQTSREPPTEANLSVQVTPSNGAAKPSKTPAQSSSPLSRREPDILLARSTFFGHPFETVRVDGTYSPLDSPTELRVQWQRRDEWVSFPLHVVPDPSGDFAAYVEFGRTGRHQLRVLDPRTGATSGVAVLYVR